MTRPPKDRHNNKSIPNSRGERPLVTFALFAYNQERFVREAIEGAFSQTYGPLEIILSDDASTDNTFDIMRHLVSEYSGKHAVICRRNQKNMGIGAHINTVMEISTGRFVIAAAGDDISHPNRTECVVSEFLKGGAEIYSVWSKARYIDEHGLPIARQFPGKSGQYTETQMVRNLRPVIGATHAWRREVFDFFGPLSERVHFEDNAISFRSYLIGEIRYINESLVRYRAHSYSSTNFPSIRDPRERYILAAARAEKALAGVDQRISDLETAERRLPVNSWSPRILKHELMQMKRTFQTRKAAYKEFPAISSQLVFSSLHDWAVFKVLIRTLVLHLTEIFNSRSRN